MKLNESVAVSTPRAVLVPYDRRHVEKYHAWMEDPAIQEATASERLTLDEEYENQASWRASHDKLTFIICQPLTSPTTPGEPGRERNEVRAGEDDVPERMVGDVNFFLYPYDDDENEEQEDGNAVNGSEKPPRCVGEVDIMIADAGDRGKGVGRAVVAAFLHYIWRNLEMVLSEYSSLHDDARFRQAGLELTMLMAKIKRNNTKSIALFKSLGFEQEGEVNYFGEVRLVLHDFAKVVAVAPDGYAELVYRRSGCDNA